MLLPSASGPRPPFPVPPAFSAKASRCSAVSLPKTNDFCTPSKPSLVTIKATWLPSGNSMDTAPCESVVNVNVSASAVKETEALPNGLPAASVTCRLKTVLGPNGGGVRPGCNKKNAPTAPTTSSRTSNRKLGMTWSMGSTTL